MASEATLLKRENRLLGQHRSIRGTCRGATFLCLFFLAGVFLLADQDELPAGRGMGSGQMSVMFLLVAWVMDEKLKHIRTIRRYRAMGQGGRETQRV